MAELSTGFVCIMGMGIVFIGLICIVFICMLMSFCVTKLEKGDKNSGGTSVPVVPAVGSAAELPADEKRKVIAGVCAVIAEELGTDVSNIRVLSFKKA